MPPNLPRPLRRGLLLGLASLLVLAAWPAAAQQLTVSAAASLTDAFKQIGARFEAGHPGAAVRFNFAASGVLIQQIAHGAPVDVFVSADEETMRRGVEQQLLDAATRRDFASNSLVLIVPTVGAPPLSTLADLGKPAVKRIAIGKTATVPVGRYTQQALEAAGLWSALLPRFVQADSVRQVLDYVARGEADAGFVYRTDALLMPDKVAIVQTLKGHAPVRYPAAVVAETRNAELARAFVAFLGRGEAQSILAQHGFGKPDD
jgi:molybdate transport system substrate-binding protein